MPFSDVPRCQESLLFGLGGILLACLTIPGVAGEPVRPNILLMMVDDLGYSDFGCYGAEIDTPHIDQLADSGLRLSQFYNTAKCHSSRICLLTGKYELQAGGKSMAKTLTIAEVLRTQGYFTAMAGKWHLDQEPTDRGFERYWGHLSGATNFFTGDDTFRLNGKPWAEFDDGFYTTDANVNFALQFMDEALESGKPFFQYIAFNAPHYPLQAKRPDVEKYRGRYAMGWDEVRRHRYRRQVQSGLISENHQLSPRPTEIPAWEDLTPEQRSWDEKRMEVFAAMVDCVDQNIGRLITWLKDHQQFENTLILLCSDNGGCPFDRTRGRRFPPWDPKSYWCYDVGWAHACNTPFRWYKQNQHEGGIASPMIAHWPNGLKCEPGSIDHQPGHLIDLLPTCLDAAQIDYPGEFAGKPTTPVQGRSLMPLLRGQSRQGHDWMYFRFSNNRALRRGDWKAVSARGGRWELYNLAKDRTEITDVAAQHPDTLMELTELWHSVASSVEHAPPKFVRPVSNELKRFPPGQMTERD